MADYTVQEISVSGLEPSLSAATSGDTIALQGDQREFVVVNNGSGASIDVTIPAQTTSVKISGVGALDDQRLEERRVGTDEVPARLRCTAHEGEGIRVVREYLELLVTRIDQEHAGEGVRHHGPTGHDEFRAAW